MKWDEMLSTNNRLGWMETSDLTYIFTREYNMSTGMYSCIYAVVSNIEDIEDEETRKK